MPGKKRKFSSLPSFITHLCSGPRVLHTMSPVLAGDLSKLLGSGAVLPAVVPGCMGKHLQ